VAFIPLRGGSKRISFKNIKEIAGKPLAFWVIGAALNCPLIDKVFVSTDSLKIKKKISEINNDKLQIVERSKKTATDNASTESAMLEFAKKYPVFNYIILIQATSPLLENSHLTRGIKKYFSKKYDSLLSVARQKRFIWKEKNSQVKPVNYNPFKRPFSQDFKGFLVENGAFYITKRENLIESCCRISGKIGAYEMPEETYHELDNYNDWQIIENLLILRKRRILRKKTKKIKMIIFDVDGVFTDGSVYLDKDGKETLRFSRVDGKGIELLRKNNYVVAVISSEESEIVRKRMKKLKIKELYLGVKNKLNQYNKLKEKYKLKNEEICFCGDDVQDIPVIKRVGFSACPKNAVYEIKQICDYVSDKKGGEGFVRDIYNFFKK